MSKCVNESCIYSFNHLVIYSFIMKWIPALEIFLVEVVIFMALWLLAPFWASMFTFIIPMIGIPILLIALIAELLERTRISRMYFAVMLISILVPPLVAIIYSLLSGNEWNFMNFEWLG